MVSLLCNLITVLSKLHPSPTFLPYVHVTGKPSADICFTVESPRTVSESPPLCFRT